MKMVTSRLWHWLLDANLDKLLWIAIEGPELDSHDFEKLFALLRETSSRVIKI